MQKSKFNDNQYYISTTKFLANPPDKEVTVDFEEIHKILQELEKEKQKFIEQYKKLPKFALVYINSQIKIVQCKNTGKYIIVQLN